MGKTRRKKSFLGSSERISRNKAKGPSTFFVRTASWFCYPLDWHPRELYSGLTNFSVNFVKIWIEYTPFFSAGSQEISKDNHLIRINHQNSIFKKMESCVIVFLKLKLFFVTSQTPKFKTDNHDAIFFRWQLVLLTVNAQTNYVQYFLWILYDTKLIFVRK